MDPANAVLPWASPDGLLSPLDGSRRNRTLAPYQSRPARRCAFLVDRHVHKNGGSTVRDIWLENERLGFALYQGYNQQGWDPHPDGGREREGLYPSLMRLAESAITRGEAPNHLLLLENHFGSVNLDTMLPGLRALEELYSRNGIECPAVVMTRVREPLDYCALLRPTPAYRERTPPTSAQLTPEAY
jgi:hypothetical protein